MVEGLRPMLDISNWSELVTVDWFIYTQNCFTGTRIVCIMLWYLFNSVHIEKAGMAAWFIHNSSQLVQQSSAYMVVSLQTTAPCGSFMFIHCYSPLALPIPDLGTVNNDGCL